MNRNLRNAIITFLAPLPFIVFYISFFRNYSSVSDSELNSMYSWCLNHPLLLANLLVFFNVNVPFWVIGLLQSSHWMIDVYWTVIPVMLVHYFDLHPLGHFAQIFLIGICLPLYVIHSIDTPLKIWDFISLAICLMGIVMAYYADTQLHEFVTGNQKLKKQGKPKTPNLDTGLWRYSRHPNYLGEQLWWWGLVIFAWNLGPGWTLIGALVNTLCLVYVTILVERRMVK